MNSNINLAEARKQAKYYGDIVRKENEVERSESEKLYFREQLSYFRTIILMRTNKRNKTNLTLIANENS